MRNQRVLPTDKNRQPIGRPMRNSIRRSPRHRRGKAMVMLAVLLPGIIVFVALVIDSGWAFNERRNLQHVADASATACAYAIHQGRDDAEIRSAADDVAKDFSPIPDVALEINRPPSRGPFAGNPDFVEVGLRREHRTLLMNAAAGEDELPMRVRAVAGVGSNTPGAALVVLDPNPDGIEIPGVEELLNSLSDPAIISAATNQSNINDLIDSIPLIGNLLSNLLKSQLNSSLVSETLDLVDYVNTQVHNGTLPPLPQLIAGLEVEGLGRLRVDGSVHVNTEWGSVDENGNLAGTNDGIPYGIACMPLLPTTSMQARHIRVAGGVDYPNRYGPFEPGGTPPLRANQLPVPDPLIDLPRPASTSGANQGDLIRVVLSVTSAANVVDQVLTGLTPLGRSVLGGIRSNIEANLSAVELQPGVYNSLTIVAPVGGVRLQPGVYEIRGRNPITQLSLCLVGPIEAEGVLFYISQEDQSNAVVDASSPPPPSVVNLLPSTLVLPLLPGARYTGLQSPGNPLDQMLIFQSRSDRRPILIEAQHLVGNTSLRGTIYSKWGHVGLISAIGQYDLRIVSGTARVLTIGTTTLAPQTLLPPARDVYLVE